MALAATEASKRRNKRAQDRTLALDQPGSRRPSAVSFSCFAFFAFLERVAMMRFWTRLGTGRDLSKKN